LLNIQAMLSNYIIKPCNFTDEELQNSFFERGK